jgi:hypothetical protein
MMPLNVLESRLANENRANWARGREARGHVHRITHNRVALVRISSEHACVDAPSTDANPNLHRLANAFSNLTVVVGELCLHRQGSIDGALGIVVMCHERTKERHHCVSNKLIDCASKRRDERTQTIKPAVHEVA